MFNPKGMFRKGILYLLSKMPWSYQDRIYYFRRFKKLPNLHRPTLFNEKVLYRKFFTSSDERFSLLSDKYLVREYISNTIGDEYLVPLVHETVDPLTILALTSLKNTVIKPNHGSGMVEILLNEPDEMQKQLLIKRCHDWLKHDFSSESREIHYRYIKPRILVEKYIGNGKCAAVDYKFHMFNKKDGRFEYVLQVIYNRCGDAPLSMNFYVNNLRECFYKIRDTGLDISGKQRALRKMLNLSKRLATDFDYVRVDWYIYQEQIFFGELTFTPGAGMVTGLEQGLNKIMGDMWLQEVKSDVAAHDPTSPETVTIPAVLKKI